MKDLEAKNSLNIKGLIDLFVGGEDRENYLKSPFKDVWNRNLSNLWRSDVVTFDLIKV